ncbi:hypothetical protein CHELA40_15472 [Chelatococcus asaccharovorans]|nr:hypothetical protein CHELA17_60144 [Chelatococcus asaccharovorans]CAH1682617.1 hypothetical protein CHELA40_15472 [Chelatococcus asaccharovorans]
MSWTYLLLGMVLWGRKALALGHDACGGHERGARDRQSAVAVSGRIAQFHYKFAQFALYLKYNWQKYN